MMSPTKLKIALTLVALFLIGCIVGGSVVFTFRARPTPPMFGNMTERQLDRMAEDLALSQDQVARIEPILVEIHASAQAVRRASMAEFARIYGEMTERVEAVLTPEQVQVFRVRQEERRKRADSMLNHRRSEKERGGPGGRRGYEGPPPPELLDPPPQGLGQPPPPGPGS